MEFTVSREEAGWVFVSSDKKYSIVEREDDGLLLPYVYGAKEGGFIWTEDYVRTIDEAVQSMLHYERHIKD